MSTSINTIVGTDGDDLLTGTAGDDRIYGNLGRDTIYGGAGDDTLYGRGEDALLSGDDGNDVFSLSTGRAGGLLTGGQGQDTYINWFYAPSTYRITDFQVGTGGDILDLSYVLSKTPGYYGGNPFSAGVLRLLQSGTDTLVQWDMHGAGGNYGFQTLYTLSNVEVNSLTADNFTHGLKPDGSVMTGVQVDGTAGNDELYGTLFNDILRGYDGDDSLIADGGDDLLDGGSGSDFLVGGFGNDTLLGGDGDDSMQGGGSESPGSDFLDGGNGNDTLWGSGVALVILGGEGNDSIRGYAEDLGNGGRAELNGGGGNDYIEFKSAGGDGLISGGTGNDTFSIDSSYFGIDEKWGNATITDFEANDAVDLTRQLNYSYKYGATTSGKNPFAPDMGFFKLVQSGSDVLLQYDVDGANGSLYGFKTILTLQNTNAATLSSKNFGGLAPDGSSFDAIHVDGTDQADVINGTAFPTVENGMGGDDTLNGGNANDTLLGGEGNDFLDGGAGRNSLDGGTGNDTLQLYSGDTGMGGDGDDFIALHPTQHNLYEDITAQGGAGDDVFTIADYSGTYQYNRWGYVDLSGGSGVDTYRLGIPASTIVIEDFVAGHGGDVIDMSGILGSDYFKDGFVGDNPFAPNANAFRLSQVGNDAQIEYNLSYKTMYSGPTYAVVAILHNVDASSLTTENFGGIDPHGTPYAGQNIEGSSGDDFLTGTPFADTIKGGDGWDRIYGGGANDVIDGGAGDDYLSGLAWAVESGFDLDTLTGGEGNDTLFSGASLDGGNGNDTLYVRSGPAEVKAWGGDGDDTFILTSAGEAVAHSHVWGGSGNDIFKLGTYLVAGQVIEIEDFASGDSIDLQDFLSNFGSPMGVSNYPGGSPFTSGHMRLVQQGSDAVLEVRTWAGPNSHFEPLLILKNISAASLTAADFSGIPPDGTQVAGKVINLDGSTWRCDGTLFADTITGTAGDELINGGGGDDIIDGGSGSDSINGGNGNDTLIGGAGDILDGGAGTDTYVLLASGAVISGYSPEDTAIVKYSGTYQLYEELGNAVAGAGFSVNLIGNGLANKLAGNSLANSIAGGWGADTLDGGGGQDTLAGGYGDDTYVVNNAGVTIVEVPNGEYSAGTDVVLTSLSKYQLTVNVEDLRYTGNDAFVGLGNSGNNHLYGGVGNDSLSGLDGGDILEGGEGNDTLVGGAGDDILYFTAGNDLLLGDSGNDYAVFSGNGSDYSIRQTAINEFLVTRLATGEHATVRDVETFKFDDTSYFTKYMYSTVPTAFNDSLLGTSGDDTLDGLGGNDLLFGGAGNDTFIVDNPNDRAIEWENEGIDNVVVNFGGTVPYVLPANVENASVHVNFKGIASITGNDLDNGIKGNDAANTLIGGAGNDTLDGAGGADSLAGGKGDDIYYVDAVGDVVMELAGEGNDTVITKLAAYKLGADVENLWGQVSTGFNGTGNIGDNSIRGSVGNDSLSGLAGNDTLVGDQGNDSLLGGDGDDLLNAGQAGAPAANGIADLIDGGAGTDTVVVLGEFSSYTRSRPNLIDTLLVNSVTHENIVLRNVEFVTFADGTTMKIDDIQAGVSSPLGDQLAGTEGDDYLDGLAGADTLTGLAGNDTYKVDNVGDRIIEAENGGLDKVNVALNNGVYQMDANVEEAYVISGANFTVGVTGNELDNKIVGSDGANALSGGAGNDTLIGGKGSDRLAGGTGDDSYDVDSSGDTVMELAGEGEDTVFTSLTTYKLGANVENLAYNGKGTSFNGTGNELANHIIGSIGRDVLSGGAGNDTLVGNGGIDLLDGGAGEDIAVLSGARSDYVVTRPNANDIVLTRSSTEIVTLRTVESVQFSDGTISVKSLIENVISPFADYLTGTNGDDTLNGAAGADTMAGGAGNDHYVVDVSSDVIMEVDNGGFDSVDVALMSGTYVLPENVENAEIISKAAVSVTGNSMDNILTGNALANTLTGGAGNDTLDGKGGSDRLIGGTGDDTYYVDSSGDVITELAGEGYDKVITSLATYTLAANVEDLAYGSTGLFKLTGNTLDNSIQITGTASGTVDGSAGSDVVIIDGSVDDFIRTRPNATDLMLTKGSQVITLRNVEAVGFRDPADGAVLAKSYADLIFNITSIGNDILVGDSGDNRIDGGKGADDMTGGDGNDTYVVDVVTDVIHEAAAGGHDKVEVNFAVVGTYVLSDNIEDAVIMGALAVNVTGNAEDNTLTGNSGANKLIGGDGNDSLSGMAGNDTLQGGSGNDSIDGGAGSDRLEGGAGDDKYYVDATGDVVVELSSDGNDTVYAASTSYTLSANVENLTYTGSGAFAGTGSIDNNVITGGNGNDILSGMAGDDTLSGGLGNDKLLGGDGNDSLIGGAGSDTLTGGSGADTFVLDSTTGIDTITDFLSGTDKIQIRLPIGNGDAILDGAETRNAAGGFSAAAELVMFTQNVATMNVANAAAAIGSAASSYHTGDTALFALRSGTATALFKFTSAGDDAQVSAAELTQLVTLTGASSVAVSDFIVG